VGKRAKYLSEEQVKLRVMAYLFSQGEIGANSYTIQHKANIPVQESNRFRHFLEDLYDKKCISISKMDTANPDPDKRRPIYKIDDKGRKIIEEYRRSTFIQEVFGSIDDVFEKGNKYFA
jgi:predicted transcriptional regulator